MVGFILTTVIYFGTFTKVVYTLLCKDVYLYGKQQQALTQKVDRSCQLYYDTWWWYSITSSYPFVCHCCQVHGLAIPQSQFVSPPTPPYPNNGTTRVGCCIQHRRSVTIHHNGIHYKHHIPFLAIAARSMALLYHSHPACIVPLTMAQQGSEVAWKTSPQIPTTLKAKFSHLKEFI